jgi:two-component system, OmpR family, response regulator VicR
MRRILFVDDDFAVAEVTRMVLEHEGYTVLVASNGEDAFHSAEAERPDLVITDFMMPIMNGGELVRRMRAEPQLEQIPIIMVTANDVSGIPGIEHCRRVLRKPITIDMLVTAIRSLLG